MKKRARARRVVRFIQTVSAVVWPRLFLLVHDFRVENVRATVTHVKERSFPLCCLCTNFCRTGSARVTCPFVDQPAPAPRDLLLSTTRREKTE